jgi:hypothetical protein
MGENTAAVGNNLQEHWVSCESESCVYQSGIQPTESEAIEAHNQLAALREENERLRGLHANPSTPALLATCRSCQAEHEILLMYCENCGASMDVREKGK